MPSLTRRQAALVLLAAPLAACATAPTTPAIPVWVTDLQNIVTDLTKYLPSGVAPAVVALVGQAQSIYTAIASAVAGGGGVAGLVSSFAGIIGDIFGAIGGINASGIFATALQAAMSLLPTILSLAGVAMRQAASASFMPPAEARALLAGLAR